MSNNKDLINKNLKIKYPTSNFLGDNEVALSAKIFDSEIENCVIGEYVKIYKSKLKNTKIESNSIIGNVESINQFLNKKIFDSDGIRGEFNKDITLDLVKKLTNVLCNENPKKIVIGYDTRPVSKILHKTICDIFKNNNIEIFDLKLSPTAAVVFYAKELNADFAICVTASHSPSNICGIKIFEKQGKKINNKLIEKLSKNINKKLKICKNKEKLNKKILNLNKYYNFIKNIDKNYFDNLKIIIDCANGSASQIAPKIFEDLHANVVALNTNGNINENCGSVFPESLRMAVVKNKADLGFAFDGDADRIIAVNKRGQILTGDDILFLLAWYYKKQNVMTSNTIVGTLLTNTGIENKLKSLGLSLLRTPVGDKYIEEELENKYDLGGEQAGHILVKKHILTCDGILVARILASVYLENQHIFESVKENKYIQINKDLDLKFPLPENFFEEKEFLNLIKFYSVKMGSSGRFVIRPSGTEPKIRIMVETTDKNTSLIFALDIKKKLGKLLKNLPN